MLRQPHVAGHGQKCVAVQITLFFCNPTTTVLLAWVCLGEPLVPRALAGIACSLAGVVVVTKPPFLFGGQEMWTSSRLLGAQPPRYRLCIMAPSSPSSCSTACKQAHRPAQAAEACWTLHQTWPGQPCCACACFQSHAGSPAGTVKGQIRNGWPSCQCRRRLLRHLGRPDLFHGLCGHTQDRTG